MPPATQPQQPPQHGAAKSAASAPPTSAAQIDWDATITLIEQAMPNQLFALELLRELGHVLNPTQPPQ